MTCRDLSILYGIPNYPECSGYGACEHGSCSCDVGWLGVGDSDQEAIDCDINLNAIKAWAVFNLVISSILWIVVFILILRTAMKEKMFVKRNRHKVFVFRKHRASVFAFYTLANLFISLGSIEVAAKLNTFPVGADLVADIWLVCVMGSICYGTTSYFSVLINFLKNTSRFADIDTRKDIEMTKVIIVYSKYAPRLIIFGMTISIIFLHTFNHKFKHIIVIIICVELLISYSFYTYCIFKIVPIFLTELRKHLSESPVQATKSTSSIRNNSSHSLYTSIYNTQRDQMIAHSSRGLNREIQIVYHKMATVYRMFCMSTILVPLIIAFLSWSFLRRKLVFLFLGCATFVCIFTLTVIWSLMTVAKSDNSNLVKLSFVREVKVTPDIISSKSRAFVDSNLIV